MPFLNNPDCDCCGAGCSVCSESTISVTFGGFVDGFCANCDEDLNATFVLDYAPQPGQPCEWDYTEPAFCTFRDLYIFLVISMSGADWILSVTVSFVGAGAAWTFSKNFGATPPDCATTHTLTLVSSYEPMGAACLNGGAVSCQVN